jgi:hypothetical protein
VSRLRKLFGSSRPAARKARLGVEALGDRLVPSVSFNESTGPASVHSLTVTTGGHQNDTVTIRNDGDGNLRITANGTTRSYQHVTDLSVATGDGQDTVTYNQGAPGHEADSRRSLYLDVQLGSLFDSNDADRFTANVFGDVVNGQSMILNVKGGNDTDRIDFRLHDTDVHGGSTLWVWAQGEGGNDSITLNADGELDGEFTLIADGGGGDDSIDVDVLLDAGSSGYFGRDDGLDNEVTGRDGSDHLRFAVRAAAGAHAEVHATVSGSVGWLEVLDQDVGRHTANVQPWGLEDDIQIV